MGKQKFRKVGEVYEPVKENNGCQTVLGYIVGIFILVVIIGACSNQ
jgi:hypothetical protein